MDFVGSPYCIEAAHSFVEPGLPDMVYLASTGEGQVVVLMDDS